VAIVGATGVVGQAFVRILEKRNFPVGSLRLLASERSSGKHLMFNGKAIPVELISERAFEGIDLAFFSAGADVSKDFVPIAAGKGAIVIDNTSQFRMEPDVPLVVPEVNAHRIAYCKKRRIIANPNCSTIQLVVVLHALRQRAKIKRVVVATYQSVSGAGLEAIETLSKHGERSFDCVPHIDRFLEDGYTKEEWKMMNETSKIMEEKIPMTATCVRVPVFYGHSEAVNIEFESALLAEEARKILKETPGVAVVDDPASDQYPLAVDCAGKDPIFVGRIREDKTVPHGLSLWIVADNVRKGAALNAIQIVEGVKSQVD
ncbi:MAG: aspartate-semialdehyde dehydrogenase, partial [Deltaproteobacteria bacterium]|nr:aspartate-semialdehyde dehydrogenase [Deltaproteobacteria bacterium]